MELEYVSCLQGEKQQCWRSLMQRAGLIPGEIPDITVLAWEGEILAAAGSRQGNIFKYIAVDPAFQGQDLTAKVLTALRQDAFARGVTPLFLYTKPQNVAMFTPLFFYPIAQTDDILLMEDVRGGITRYMDSLPVPCRSGTIGAAVMNCNPFTLGHRHLIETAARDCDWLYVFVLSEEQSPFPAADRLRLVQQGTADLPHVTVLPTGPYLLSSATFPDYFLKDRENCETAHCMLDIQVFIQYYAPHFGITRRYVGTEPFSPLTDQYNRILKTMLPRQGIEVREIPRKENENGPISASTVRSLLGTGQELLLRTLVPDTTMTYLKEKNFI